MRPHNLPAVLLGAGLLWFGWFGFNAGLALGANKLAATAFTTTMTVGATAVISWLVVEQIRDGRPTTLGAASGAVAGLVAITPAGAFVQPLDAAAIGVVAGAVCALAVGMKYRAGYDVTAFLVTLGIGFLVKATIGFRVEGEVEVGGIDEVEHAESGYEFSTLAGVGARGTGLSATASVVSAGREGARR